MFHQILVVTLFDVPFSQDFSVNAGDTPFMSQVRVLPESPDSVAQLAERNVSPSTRHRALSRNQPFSVNADETTSVAGSNPAGNPGVAVAQR